MDFAHGWSSYPENARVATFDVGRSRARFPARPSPRTSPGSSTARTPCEMRVTPGSVAAPRARTPRPRAPPRGTVQPRPRAAGDLIRRRERRGRVPRLVTREVEADDVRMPLFGVARAISTARLHPEVAHRHDEDPGLDAAVAARVVDPRGDPAVALLVPETDVARRGRATRSTRRRSLPPAHSPSGTRTRCRGSPPRADHPRREVVRSQEVEEVDPLEAVGPREDALLRRSEPVAGGERLDQRRRRRSPRGGRAARQSARFIRAPAAPGARRAARLRRARRRAARRRPPRRWRRPGVDERERAVGTDLWRRSARPG